MVISDRLKKIPVAPCPLCGGDVLTAEEKWTITNEEPGIDGFLVSTDFQIRCPECTCRMWLTAMNEKPDVESARQEALDTLKYYEDHWARRHYKEVDDGDTDT